MLSATLSARVELTPTTRVVYDCGVKTAVPSGELEYAVLTILWERGELSAREVHDHVGEPRGLVYTTVTKVLDRLHEKGFVARSRSGKAFIYVPKVQRAAVDQARAQAAVSRLLGAGPKPAVAALVDAVESIDPSLLDELERLVAARRRERDGS